MQEKVEMLFKTYFITFHWCALQNLKTLRIVENAAFMLLLPYKTIRNSWGVGFRDNNSK